MQTGPSRVSGLAVLLVGWFCNSADAARQGAAHALTSLSETSKSKSTAEVIAAIHRSR